MELSEEARRATKKEESSHPELWEMGLKSIRELETERGILASSRNEAYGCIFGRDSLITALSLLRMYAQTKDPYFLTLVGKIVSNLAELQGREINIESGEEPGKMIHEYRPERHEHLTKASVSPWYVYPDRIMRNYDTVDATPLFLMTVYEYFRAAGEEAVKPLIPSVQSALRWILNYGDSNGDGFIDYRFPPERVSGGLKAQSWMDSHESVFFEESKEAPSYPIAPVEVQAYTYVALQSWGQYFKGRDTNLSRTLFTRAELLRSRFNGAFVQKDGDDYSLAFALEGNGRPLSSPRSSMGHCLFAAWRENEAAEMESILEPKYIPGLVRRLLRDDLYVEGVGMRTLSTQSVAYDPYSYHNGSIWPHDTALIAEGLQNFGYRTEARALRGGLVRAYKHFKTPIELFSYTDEGFREYAGPNGQGACRVQAWSAASLLTILTSLGGVYSLELES